MKKWLDEWLGFEIEDTGYFRGVIKHKALLNRVEIGDRCAMSLLAAIMPEGRTHVYQSVPLIIISRIRSNQSKRNIFPDDIFRIIIPMR